MSAILDWFVCNSFVEKSKNVIKHLCRFNHVYEIVSILFSSWFLLGSHTQLIVVSVWLFGNYFRPRLKIDKWILNLTSTTTERMKCNSTTLCWDSFMWKNHDISFHHFRNLIKNKISFSNVFGLLLDSFFVFEMNSVRNEKSQFVSSALVVMHF